MRCLALLPTSLLLLSACAEKREAPQAIGMANPASVYCGKIGGKLELRQETGGAAGYCHLPDGRVVEEWALYREAHAQR